MSEATGADGEPHGHICPECAAPRALDDTPSCSCNRRASEALRDARTAQAAAAEDFNPLRIRPYVELGSDPKDFPTLAIPVAPTRPHPDSAVIHLPEERTPKPTPPTTPERTPRRGNRVMLAAAGAATTVLAAVGLAAGLSVYDTPTRDQALPDDLRASVPDTSTDDSASPTKLSGTAEPAPPAANAPPTPSRTSPSPPPSKPHSSTRPYASPPPSAPAPSPTPGPPGPPGPDEADQGSHPQTLRLGDNGPEVTELQLRLRQLNIYLGDIDENFDDQVEAAVRQYQFTRNINDDAPGTYGTTTRKQLESETHNPQTQRHGELRVS